MDITNFVHRTNNLDPTRCSHRVHDEGRGVGFHQCQRNVYEAIDGYGFCKQHYKKVSRSMGLDDSDTVVKYTVHIDRDGNPELSMLELYSETEKTIDVKSSKSIIGDIFILTGKQRKNTRYFSYDLFDDIETAVSHLIEACENRIKTLEDNLATTIENVESFYNKAEEIQERYS